MRRRRRRRRGTTREHLRLRRARSPACGRAVRPCLACPVDVAVEQLEALLSGHDPVPGTRLGRELVEQVDPGRANGAGGLGVRRDVLATEVAVGVMGTTGDRRVLDAHDVAVAAALADLDSSVDDPHPLQRWPTSSGHERVTIARFRHTTSRVVDPQIHTHAVISAKVQTATAAGWRSMLAT